MNKSTKLGIPDSLLIALIFAAGLVSPIIMIGLIVYVLLFEKAEHIKSAALKALMIFGLFAILQGGLGVFNSVMRVLLANEDGYSKVYINLSYILSGAETLTYLVYALKEARTYMTARGAGIYVPEEPAAETEEKPTVCPQCGNTLDKGVHFCKKCGTKTN